MTLEWAYCRYVPRGVEMACAPPSHGNTSRDRFTMPRRKRDGEMEEEGRESEGEPFAGHFAPRSPHATLLLPGCVCLFVCVCWGASLGGECSRRTSDKQGGS
ncbi:hypothetical protein O3P69_017066 [Scylla paramamosain]|uniref:Uncharacterized protein n=1 Tax=Scylla paramamosain TaxID=85552 RepID=A0AAW0TV05_SCYPA